MDQTIAWYHDQLQHPGMNRQYLSMSKVFHHPDLKRLVESYIKTCGPCQRNKRSKKYGWLPEKIVDSNPWEVIAVDLIGPWKIKDADERNLNLLALTIIDLATCWIEIVEIKDKRPVTVAKALDRVWFCRYP